MTAEAPTAASWHEVNQRYLVAALAGVRRALEPRDADQRGVDWTGDPSLPRVSPPAALERLCRVFGLSTFERDVLLLCAGVELDASFASLVASASGDATRAGPTFSLALAALPEAHWSALTPAAPLRYWRLIDVVAGASLTQSALRIDERILHFLTGVDYVDERLAGVVEQLDDADAPPCPWRSAPADRLESLWRRRENAGELPPVQLIGADPSGQRDLALAACAALHLGLQRAVAAALPTGGQELDALVRLWQRESALTGQALLLDCNDLDEADAGRVAAVRKVVDSLRGPLIVCARQPLRATSRALVTVEIGRPTASEQAWHWRERLGDAASDAEIEAVVSQFSLSTPAIGAVADEALAGALEHGEWAGATLWGLCRVQTRPRLDALAQRIDARATWDDLVLPEPQLRLLREAALHVRQRAIVYERWGFADRYARGLGIGLLAAGPSGTGKTMAAEVLANDLRLDLYHIDLSQVVSKYIGETEKNLARLFDAAEAGGAILLFDEADALFGKRSEVRDSHDRYANIEVSYLLQRMEAYRGLAILTTNMKDALDPAFLRRIRFVVQFPFPDEGLRARIWRGVLPAATPTACLDYRQLARLSLSGGNIRNVAMNAAFLAAEAGSPVTMRHIAAAARAEFMKIDKTLNEAVLAGWQ
jgi:hypothetical protein